MLAGTIWIDWYRDRRRVASARVDKYGGVANLILMHSMRSLCNALRL